MYIGFLNMKKPGPGPEGVIVEVYKYLGKRHKIRIKTKLIDFSITYIIRLLNTSPFLIISCTQLRGSKAQVLYMSFDRFLLAVESCDLSQADKSII